MDIKHPLLFANHLTLDLHQTVASVLPISSSLTAFPPYQIRHIRSSNVNMLICFDSKQIAPSTHNKVASPEETVTSYTQVYYQIEPADPNQIRHYVRHMLNWCLARIFDLSEGVPKFNVSKTSQTQFTGKYPWHYCTRRSGYINPIWNCYGRTWSSLRALHKTQKNILQIRLSRRDSN